MMPTNHPTVMTNTPTLKQQKQAQKKNKKQKKKTYWWQELFPF
jgi:hypothetical protein